MKPRFQLLLKCLSLSLFLGGILLQNADAQSFKRGYLGVGYASGLAKEPLSVGFRANGGGVLLEGGYLQSHGDRWLFGADISYLSLAMKMNAYSDLQYFGVKASQEQRFGLSYDDLLAKCVLANLSAGYYLTGKQANWRPWVGVGFGYTLTTFAYLHPVTNTRVYIGHYRPGITSTLGLQGVARKWYFDFRLDAMPVSLLSKHQKTNTLNERVSGPTGQGPAPARFEAGASRMLGNHFLIGPSISGIHRYAGDKNGGFLALSFGLRLGYQIGSWGTPHEKRVKIHPKKEEDKDTEHEEPEGGKEDEPEKVD